MCHQVSFLMAGAIYDASDQELLLWVHATLIDSAMVAYDLFVAPLNPGARADYYSDSKKLAALFGIQENNIPSSVEAFGSYMTEILADGGIVPGSYCQESGGRCSLSESVDLKTGGFRFSLGHRRLTSCKTSRRVWVGVERAKREKAFVRGENDSFACYL